MHSEQYSSFLALSSSVSGLDALEAAMPPAPGTGGPDPGCSEGALPGPQPGEDETAGFRRGMGPGRSGHAKGMAESTGGVGGVVRAGRGPGASRATFNCDRGCVSSAKQQRDTDRGRNRTRVKCSAKANNRTDFVFHRAHNSKQVLNY